VKLLPSNSHSWKPGMVPVVKATNRPRTVSATTSSAEKAGPIVVAVSPS
jgi:hypothetical protein